MRKLSEILKDKEVAKLNKMASLKHADATPTIYIVEKSGVFKAVKELTEIENDKTLHVKVAINTTNLIDSHCDLHVNGLWKKSVKESKGLYLFQEHKYSFDKIISDKVQPSTKIMSWKELGYNYEGETEVLIFDAEIDPSENELMAIKYKKGKVKNHSVGMRYIKLALCINSDKRYDEEEKANWDKYYPMVSNKEVADDLGFFWAVIEAKIIEGSAVPIGSNQATPTMEISESKEADIITSNEPLNDTLTTDDIKEIFKLLRN